MTTRGWVLLGVIVPAMLAYAIPLALMPLRWARLFGWTIPDDALLARYFARSLGGVMMAIGGFGIWAAFHPALERPALALGAAAMGTAAVVHLVGAIEGSQPALESWEILLWLSGAVGFAWLAWA